MTDAAPKPRRLLQFRLRTLLILVLLVSLAMCWLTRPARKQRAAVRRIEQEWDGYVGYSYDGGELPHECVQLYEHEKLEKWSGILDENDFWDIISVDVANSKSADRLFSTLKQLPHLQYLGIAGSSITDEHLVALSQ